MVDDQPSYFEQHKSLLAMTVSGSFARTHATTVEGQMRRAQLGAAFAVAAHFTIHSEPALVSMPTGSGKSAVMTLLSFLLGSRRVLVITPSKLLRDQLADEFTLLRVAGKFSTRSERIGAGARPASLCRALAGRVRAWFVFQPSG